MIVGSGEVFIQHTKQHMLMGFQNRVMAVKGAGKFEGQQLETHTPTHSGLLLQGWDWISLATIFLTTLCEDEWIYARSREYGSPKMGPKITHTKSENICMIHQESIYIYIYIYIIYLDDIALPRQGSTESPKTRNRTFVKVPFFTQTNTNRLLIEFWKKLRIFMFAARSNMDACPTHHRLYNAN